MIHAQHPIQHLAQITHSVTAALLPLSFLYILTVSRSTGSPTIERMMHIPSKGPALLEQSPDQVLKVGHSLLSVFPSP